jgi:hypothetical protein
LLVRHVSVFHWMSFHALLPWERACLRYPNSLRHTRDSNSERLKAEASRKHRVVKIKNDVRVN